MRNDRRALLLAINVDREYGRQNIIAIYQSQEQHFHYALREPSCACKRFRHPLNLHRNSQTYESDAFGGSKPALLHAGCRSALTEMTSRTTITKRKRLLVSATLVIGSALLCFSSHSLAWFGQSSLTPVINPQACSYDATTGRLTIKGENFLRGAMVTLKAPA